MRWETRCHGLGTRAFMKGGCKRRGHDFHTYIIFKGIRLFLWSWPMPPLWPGVIGPHCLYIPHIGGSLSVYPETVHDSAPHRPLLASGQLPERPWTTYQLLLTTLSTSTLMYHFHRGHYLGLFPSRVSPESGPPRPCLLLLWHVPSCTPVLVQDSHTHPPTHQHKQGLAVFIRAEWCMILCSKCAYEPRKSSTTFEWSPYIYLILNDGRHPEIEFILLHLEDNEAMANDFSREVTTLKCTRLI